MKTIRTTNLDFSGQKLFIGIDIHKKSWVVTIRTRDIELRTFSMNPVPKELTRHLKTNYPNAEYYSVYEAGFSGFWAHRELVNLGINNSVVNPADVPTTHKEKDQKRDKIDSRKLARELTGTSLKSIYIPTKEQEAIRALSRLRIQVIKRNTQIKNRIKQFLSTRGVTLPSRSEISHWSHRFIKWLENVKLSQKHDRYYLHSLLNDLEYERKQLLGLLRQIRRIAKGNQTIKYIMTIPGIGTITAFTFYVEIIDIKRFKNLDKLANFLGFVPSVKATSDKERIQGMTNRYNKHLQSLIIEAAWIAVRKDPALTLAFQKQIKTKSKQQAIIKIAKKLINRIRFVWLNQTEYVCAVVE
jgi:transposase